MNNVDKLIDLLNQVTTANTLTEVAENLYFSQPYVSKLIAKMESEYEVKLVNRKANPISLTHAGEVILENLKSIQNAQAKLNLNLKDLKREEQGTITIAICSLVNTPPIDRLIMELHATFPNLKFDFVNFSGDVTDQDLIDGKMDLVVGRKWNNPEIHIIPLPVGELALLISDNCPLFQINAKYVEFSQDNLSTLNGCNYIGVNDSSFLQHKVNNLFEENMIHVNEIMELPDSKQASLIAARLHATTITTPQIAEKVLENKEYNLMPIPKDVIGLDMAISYRQDSSENIKAVAQSLEKILL